MDFIINRMLGIADIPSLCILTFNAGIFMYAVYMAVKNSIIYMKGSDPRPMYLVGLFWGIAINVFSMGMYIAGNHIIPRVSSSLSYVASGLIMYHFLTYSIVCNSNISLNIRASQLVRVMLSFVSLIAIELVISHCGKDIPLDMMPTGSDFHTFFLPITIYISSILLTGHTSASPAVWALSVIAVLQDAGWLIVRFFVRRESKYENFLISLCLLCIIAQPTMSAVYYLYHNYLIGKPYTPLMYIWISPIPMILYIAEKTSIAGLAICVYRSLMKSCIDLNNSDDAEMAKVDMYLGTLVKSKIKEDDGLDAIRNERIKLVKSKLQEKELSEKYVKRYLRKHGRSGKILYKKLFS